VLPGAKLQPGHDALGIGQIADDFAERGRDQSDEGRYGQDVVAPGPLRVRHQIHDLDAVVPGQLLLTDLLEVDEGPQRLRRLLAARSAAVSSKAMNTPGSP
jgi:hypothetical protein